MTDELKPCPFCGAELKAPTAVQYPKMGLARLHPGALDDGSCPIAGWGFYNEQLAAWNTRADDARIAALEQRVRELEGALKPFAFLEMEKAEGLADTQYVWEAIYLDRVQDWIAFEDIDTARKALGEQP